MTTKTTTNTAFPETGTSNGSPGATGDDGIKAAVAKSASEAAATARRAATKAHERGSDAMSSAAQGLADGVNTIARDIRGADLSTMVHRAEDFARRNPMLVTGLAVAVGFALSRFAKSSEARREADDLRHGSGRYDPHDAASRRAGSHGRSPVSYEPADPAVNERTRHYPPNPGL